jgi:hypothetical protein
LSLPSRTRSRSRGGIPVAGSLGGRTLVPPMPGINEVPYLTNSSMMDVDFCRTV